MRHVVAPGTDLVRWCAVHHLSDDDVDFSVLDDGDSRVHSVTGRGVVTCPACIELLFAYPQYYNKLRAQGLRTEAEKENHV